MKKTIFNVLIGFLIGVVFIVAIGVIQANAKPSYGIGDPWDGSEKSWEMGTVVGSGFLYVKTDVDIPHFQLEFGERVYIQYERDGFYFVEIYYSCLRNPIYGWIPKEYVLLDTNVTPLPQQGNK